MDAPLTTIQRAEKFMQIKNHLPADAVSKFKDFFIQFLMSPETDVVERRSVFFTLKSFLTSDEIFQAAGSFLYDIKY